ncbi:MAG: EamA family transporter [Colwellia sp.]|nr:EamA family transporter [Colwellia sp.]
MSLKDSLIGLFIIFIWGINFVVIAWGLEGLPPLLMGAERFLLVAVLGSIFVKRPSIPWRWLALYALSLSFGQFAFLFSAMSFGMPAGLASLVLQSQALFTLIFAGLILKEQIKPVQVLAMIVAGLGLYVIGSSGGHSGASNMAMTAVGFGLTLAAAMCWALGNIINRSINQKGYSANIGLVVWSAWIPIIPFLIASYYLEGPELIINSLINIELSSILALLYLALIASIAGYSLWSYLLGRYPAAQVAPLTLGVPVVGLTAAAILLNETLSWQQGLGIALVMIGLIINSAGKRIFTLLSKRLITNRS